MILGKKNLNAEYIRMVQKYNLLVICLRLTYVIFLQSSLFSLLFIDSHTIMLFGPPLFSFVTTNERG